MKTKTYTYHPERLPKGPWTVGKYDVQRVECADKDAPPVAFTNCECICVAIASLPEAYDALWGECQTLLSRAKAWEAQGKDEHKLGRSLVTAQELYAHREELLTILLRSGLVTVTESEQP